MEFSGAGKVLAVYDGRNVFIGVARMASWLIAGIGIVYLIVAVDLFRVHNWGLGIAFLGYAFANVGLYMSAK